MKRPEPSVNHRRPSSFRRRHLPSAIHHLPSTIFHQHPTQSSPTAHTPISSPTSYFHTPSPSFHLTKFCYTQYILRQCSAIESAWNRRWRQTTQLQSHQRHQSTRITHQEISNPASISSGEKGGKVYSRNSSMP